MHIWCKCETKWILIPCTICNRKITRNPFSPPITSLLTSPSFNHISPEFTIYQSHPFQYSTENNNEVLLTIHSLLTNANKSKVIASEYPAILHAMTPYLKKGNVIKSLFPSLVWYNLHLKPILIFYTFL